MAHRLLVALFLGLVPGHLAAQASDSTSTLPIYEQADLDRSPLIRDANGCIAALDAHSPALGSVGEALFSFIVAPDGRVEPASITLLTATDQRFAGAGRKTLLDARCRFAPGMKDGHPVRARIKQKLSWKVERRR